MAQITSGIRSILSHPAVYDGFQALLGANRARRRIVDEFVRPVPESCVLDVGCGTAVVLDYLPADIGYVGIDLSIDYIDAARAKYGERGTFLVGDVAQLPVDSIPPADRAIAIGLLHHLEDAEVRSLLAAIRGRLSPGGHLVTIDPCFDPAQSGFARFMVSRDRGQNVRSIQAYRALAKSAFDRVDSHVLHDLSRIPYSHAILECHA